MGHGWLDQARIGDLPLTDDYADAIRQIVDAAPPLSDEQRDRLATLLDGADE
jgi:hypothetical protein